jgi:hypothetical protein
VPSPWTQTSAGWRLRGSCDVPWNATRVDPPRLGRLLPSIRQVDRGAPTLHASWLLRQPITITPTNGDSYTYQHVYPSLTSVCGVRGWGEGVGPVSCRRCLRIIGDLLEEREKL